MLSIKSEQNVIVQNDAGIRGKKFHDNRFVKPFE